jgi:hypothetical protein
MAEGADTGSARSYVVANVALPGTPPLALHMFTVPPQT